MSNSALIKAIGLNRFYGKYHAVKDFNLTLHKGEVLGLLGPNGAGKSTTMQMLTGNISPSSGEITINGVDLIDEPQHAKQSIGYLPEQPPLYRDMTPVEFLNYCAKLHRITKSEQKEFVTNALDRCGLGDVQRKLINNLSKGYQQRVGIAQAILHKPDVVILDEPTVGLDPIQITQIRELIRELGKDYSVILSTHILPEVQAVCDRVQIINHGKTVFADSFDQLSEKQNSNSLVASFDSAVDEKVLGALDNIESIIKIDEKAHRYRLQYNNQPDGAAVFKLAVKNGWTLHELSPETETLEQIFMKLIHLDAPNEASEPSKNVRNRGGVL